MIDSETARDLTGDGQTPKVAITDEAGHSVEKEKVGTMGITSCLLRRYARLRVFLLIGVDGLSKKITPVCGDASRESFRDWFSPPTHPFVWKLAR